MSYLAKFFLLFSHYEILLPLILYGLAFHRKYFLIPTLLLLFTMILTPFIKSIFAIPYSPELVAKLGKNGFSFPSGHMQCTTVFYGWFLFKSSNKWLRLILVLVIIGVGFGLIYEGYHNIYDVLGAIFFAIVTISSCELVVCFIKKKKSVKSNISN